MNMKRTKILSLLIFALFAPFVVSCDDGETYADKREREDKQIKAFLSSGAQVKDDESGVYLLDVPGDIKVLTESEFAANDSTTDVSRNEYVLLNNGVYMQIVDCGTGEKLSDGETAEVLMRYTEYNIATDAIQSTNRSSTAEMTPDVMNCTNTLGVFSATFTEGTMYTTYSSPAVPGGWLSPLAYIRLGRLDSFDASLAHVRLIVPGAQGHANASANVYPCFYDITYQRSR